jgi:hypothetical protein
MTLPFDDNDMFYDLSLRQYILKENYVLNNLYLDEHIETELKSNKRFKRLLAEVSDDIYRYIYRYTLRSEIPYKRFLLAKRPDVREAVKRAMLFQTRYYLRSGGGLLKDMPGVDLERSRLIDLDRLRGEGSIASQAIGILSEIPEILYAGVIYRSLNDELEDGTY